VVSLGRAQEAKVGFDPSQGSGERGTRLPTPKTHDFTHDERVARVLDAKNETRMRSSEGRG
jgi:hypothetical protein